MNGSSWYQGRIVWGCKPGAPPPARRTIDGTLRALRSSRPAVARRGMRTPGAGRRRRRRRRRTAKKAPYKLGAVVSLTGTYAGLGAAREEHDRHGGRADQRGRRHQRPPARGRHRGRRDRSEARRSRRPTKLIDAGEGPRGPRRDRHRPDDGDARRDRHGAGIPQVSMAGGTVITAQFDKLVFQTPWTNTLVVPFELEVPAGQGHQEDRPASPTRAASARTASTVAARRACRSTASRVVAERDVQPRRHGHDGAAHEDQGRGARGRSCCGTRARRRRPSSRTSKQLGMTIPLYGRHGNARKEFIEGAGDGRRGLHVRGRQDPRPRGVRHGHRGRTRSRPTSSTATRRSTARRPSTFAGHAYDALYLIVEAMKRLPEGFTPRAAARRDREDERVRRHRRDVHVLARRTTTA